MSDSIYINTAETLTAACFPYLSGAEQMYALQEVINLIKKKERDDEIARRRAQSCFYSLDTRSDEEIEAELEDAERCIHELSRTKDGIARLIKRLGTSDLNRLRQKYPPTLSRLTFTEDGAIQLDDFNPGVIRLSTLARALYLLFLLHPEGIASGELSQWKHQLHEIYSEISPTTDTARINQTVERLCGSNANDLYVEISKIKKAFNDLYAPDLAYQYIPMLNRETKKYVIRFDRSLVSVPEWAQNILMRNLREGTDKVYLVQYFKREGYDIMSLRVVECTKFGDRRLGVAIDYKKPGKIGVITEILWPARYLTRDEEETLRIGGISEVEYRFVHMLDPRTGEFLPSKDNHGNPQFAVKWHAWKDADGRWHKPSGCRIMTSKIREEEDK